MDSKKKPSAKEDLDLKDLGIRMSDRFIDVDPRSYPMIILAILALGIAAMLFSSIPKTLSALVISLLFALAVDPVVNKVQHWRDWKILNKKTKEKTTHEPMGRYLAVSIVLGLFVIVFALGSYAIAPKVVDQIQSFAKDIPETVKGLKDIPIIGDKIGSTENQDKISKALKDLPEKLSSKDSPLGTIFESIFNGAYLGLLFIMMFVSLLLDGPRVVRNIRSLIPDKSRPAADRIAHALYRVIGKYMAGSIFVASLAGVVIGTSALILGVPLAPLLAVWIIFTNLIPQIGGFLGAVPFVAFGFTVSPLTGVICLAIFLVYQQIENHIIQPIVIGKTVKISPPITMVAALLGVSVGGILGAMLAVPFVGVTKALAAEFDFPRGIREKMIEKEIIKPEKIEKVKN